MDNVGIGDLPPEVVSEQVANLEFRECSQCGDVYLDAPDRQGNLECKHHT